MEHDGTHTGTDTSTDTDTDTAARPVTALVIRPGTIGSVITIDSSLDGIKAHLDGGYLEGINPHTGDIPWHAYVDTDGKMKGLSANAFATVLARAAGWLVDDDVLCGPAVFLGNHPEGLESNVPAGLLTVAEALANKEPGHYR